MSARLFCRDTSVLAVWVKCVFVLGLNAGDVTVETAPYLTLPLERQSEGDDGGERTSVCFHISEVWNLTRFREDEKLALCGENRQKKEENHCVGTVAYFLQKSSFYLLYGVSNQIIFSKRNVLGALCLLHHYIALQGVFLQREGRRWMV